jgi:hypothetical protein
MANIELDGPNKKIKVDSGDLTLDVPGDIVLDADGGTNLLKVTNSSSDVVLQPQVDTKDIVFKQYDGTVVATVEDNATFNIPASKLAIGGTAVTSTAAELNILDGVTATATELNLIDGVTATTAELNILDGVTATAAEINLIDGGTARGTTAIADGDGVLINDAGTMRQTTVETLKTYIGGFDVSSITGATALTEEPATTDEIVLSDAGTLKRMDFVHIMNRPAFHAYSDSTTTTSNSTATILKMDTEVYDTDSDYDPSAYRFTPTTSGRFLVYMSASYGNTNDFDHLRIIIRKGGNDIAVASTRQEGHTVLTCATVVHMNGSSDYLEAFAYQTSGGSENFSSGEHQTFFGAYRLVGL